MNRKPLSPLLAALAAVLFAPSAQASCGGAFCALNTNWDVQGVWEKPGVRLDLRAEFIDLDQLRHGSHDTRAEGIVDTHDELRTINRNYVGTLDWSINADWGLTLRLPIVSRSHGHVHNDDDGAGGVAPEHENWNFSAIGDLQAIGRHAFYHGDGSSAGLRFGLKLPTGKIREKNDSGIEAERSLQPGTGSTDAILGAYFNQRLGNLGWFVQAMWQHAINERDDFRPGYHVAADAGINYAIAPDWSLMLQLNAQHKGHDSGANAEPEESGSTQVFLSPGISYRATHDVQIYGFFQQPVYQHMRGTQLTADWSAAMGVSYQF